MPKTVIAQIDRDYLQLGPRALARRLTSYAFFEGRPLTTRGRWINPIVFTWLSFLAALPGHPRLHRPIFITGLGRSGTTILGILLSVHRDVAFLNEPKALWHVIDRRQDVNANYAINGGVFRLTAADVDRQLTDRAHRLFHRYRRLTGAARVVDKYPELIFRVEYVLSIFPDASIIFITRNGQDAVSSIVEWSSRRGQLSDRNVDDWWGRNDAKWHYFREQLVLSEPTLASIWNVASPHLDHANRAALEWIVTMREGIRQQARFPERFIRISYENLLCAPESELGRLQMACGLEPDPNVLRYAERRLYARPRRQLPKLNEQVEVLFQDTMGLLGYTNS